MRANSMSGQETMYLEMSMKEDMTLICQVNADMDARDLRFDLRAYSIKETLSICISYSGVVINSSISLLSSEASRTTCAWGARD